MRTLHLNTFSIFASYVSLYIDFIFTSVDSAKVITLMKRPNLRRKGIPLHNVPSLALQPCRLFHFGQGSRRPRFGRAVIVGPRVGLVTHKSSHPSLHLWLPVDLLSLTLLPSFSTSASACNLRHLRSSSSTTSTATRSGTASRLGVALPSCATMTKEDLSSDRINYLIWRHVFPLPYLVAWFPVRYGTVAFANANLTTQISARVQYVYQRNHQRQTRKY
jgi:hypothetical protein